MVSEVADQNVFLKLSRCDTVISEQKIETKAADDAYSPVIDLDVVYQSAKNLMHSYTVIPRRKESFAQDVVLKETVSSTPSDHIN